MIKRSVIRITTIIDGLIILLLPFVYLLIDYNSFAVALEKIIYHKVFYIFVVVPISLLFAWTGSLHTKRLLSGKRDLIRPLTEGFLIGFIPHFLWFIGNAVVETAFAAGHVWDGAKLWVADDWIKYMMNNLFYSSIVGGCFSAVALFLSLVNRIIIKFAVPSN